MIYWIFITGLNVCPGFINTHQWCYESRECKIKISPGLNDKEHTRYCRKHFIFDSPCEKFPVPRPQCVRLGGNNSLGPLTSSFGLEHFMTHSSAIQLLSPLPLYTLTGIQDGRWSEERGKQLGWGGKLGMRRFLITAFTARPQVWGISHAFCHSVMVRMFLWEELHPRQVGSSPRTRDNQSQTHHSRDAELHWRQNR